MSGIHNFDAKTLDRKLDKFGIKKTWVNLLATHLSNKIEFDYILQNNEFKNAKIEDVDLISGLSIGEVGILYEYSVAYCDHESRKINGQFFTPDDVAIFMALQSKSFEDGIWLDPCSGIGNLAWHLISIQEDPEDFLIKRIVLSDKDKLALLIARTLFTVSFQKSKKNLFDVIEKNFLEFDFLSVADNSKPDLFSTSEDLNLIPKHDFVIVNPPYLAIEIDTRFETAKSGDLYAYFLENIIKTSKGFISITPQSFTNARKFGSLRRLLLSNFRNLTIYTFDNVPANVFKGIKFGSKNSNQANSIRASIIVAKPGNGKRRITSLLRWRTSERELLFRNLNRFLSDVTLTEEYFPKVSKEFKDLFKSVTRLETLSTLCSSKPTKFMLFIPSSPRYFIPALKKPVKRASQRTLFFHNENDRDYAYLLLNSSFMYWWWRVRDGGMTISQETLFSLPLLDFKLDKKLITALEKSELENKVYKQNAGEAQENVKHPKVLLNKLNNHVIPDHANLLIGLHENSELLNKNF
jgi:hypothetical protein